MARSMWTSPRLLWVQFSWFSQDPFFSLNATAYNHIYQRIVFFHICVNSFYLTLSCLNMRRPPCTKPAPLSQFSVEALDWSAQPHPAPLGWTGTPTASQNPSPNISVGPNGSMAEWEPNPAGGATSGGKTETSTVGAVRATITFGCPHTFGHLGYENIGGRGRIRKKSQGKVRSKEYKEKYKSGEREREKRCTRTANRKKERQRE